MQYQIICHDHAKGEKVAIETGLSLKKAKRTIHHIARLGLELPEAGYRVRSADNRRVRFYTPRMRDYSIEKYVSQEDIINLLDKKYYLVYVSQGDGVDKKAVAKCIETNQISELDESINEWVDSCQWESVSEILEELTKEVENDFDLTRKQAQAFIDEYEDYIKDAIYERDQSTPLKDLLGQMDGMPVRLEMVSNYDCINSHWLESQDGYYYQESYFGDCVDALNLNPATLKKFLVSKGVTLKGRWPNKPNRDGKEWITPQGLYEEMTERCCGANLLTITALVDPSDLYPLNGANRITSVTISKGNPIGFYSDGQGGGSTFDARTNCDITLDLENDLPNGRGWRLVVDEGTRYSMISCYGVYSSFFGNELELIITEPKLAAAAA